MLEEMKGMVKTMKKRTNGILSLLAGGTIGALSGILGVGKYAVGKLHDMKKMSDKHLALYLMMDQWVAVKQEGKNLSSYFEGKGYNKIAIYGMSFAGERLVRELKNTKVIIEYGIDQNAVKLNADINIYTPEEDLQEVDAVVVTPIFFFDEIEEKLAKKFKCPIISLEEVLFTV